MVGINFKDNNKHKSIYSIRKNTKKYINDDYESLVNYGYWNFKLNEFFPNCYCNVKNNKVEFRGLIASHRCLYFSKNKKLIIFLGCGYKNYKEIIINEPRFFDRRYIILEGSGILSDNIYNSIESNSDEIRFI